LVTSSTNSYSKVLRKLIAFSPNYGINPLNNNEEYRVEKIDSNKWKVNLDLHEMKFEGVFDFSSNQKITDFIQH
jgi:hypothetical protein